MTHLTSDELVDAVDTRLAPDQALHVEQCPVCRDHLSQLIATLRGVKEVPVPEPSPLFWTHFSRRVREAVATEATPATSWIERWVIWPVLAPAAALAIVLFALVTTISDESVRPAPDARISNSVDDLADFGEQEWTLLSDMVGPVDLEIVQDAGLVRPGDAERAALELSAAEQRELLRLLQEEMDKAGG
jgi:hypothetical protein